MKVRKFLFCVSFLFVLGNLAVAQTTITGTVKDAKGMPVIRASVFPKGVKQGTTTDTLGVFSLKTNPGGFLVISAVGFADTTISINYQRNIDVILLQKTKTLQEVVVSAPENTQNESSNAIINQQNIQNTLEDYVQAEQMGAGVKNYSYNTIEKVGDKFVPVAGHVTTTANMGT